MDSLSEVSPQPEVAVDVPREVLDSALGFLAGHMNANRGKILKALEKTSKGDVAMLVTALTAPPPPE